jgi:1-acyl-sn-glycerol-3-phosphate acyltransferase
MTGTEATGRRGTVGRERPSAALSPSGYPPYRGEGIRWLLTVAVNKIGAGLFLRVRLEGRENLPPAPYVICFNHLSWADPIVLVAALPARPKMWFFGPKEEDMMVGLRNRLMRWSGTAVPYRPGNRDLVDATRRVRMLFDQGGILAVAGEGRIHVGERVVPPLNEGAAFFALRAGVPVVPVAINGTGWLGFGRRVRVRVGTPISVEGYDRRRGVAELTAEIRRQLQRLVVDFPDRPPPGRFGRWLTEVFNEWPEGSRPPLPAKSSDDDAPETERTRDVTAAAN